MKQNKSLAAVFIVMIVGALGLGYLLFDSYSTYASKKGEWDTTQDSLKRVEGAKLYPNEANSKEKEKRVLEYSENVNALRNALLDPGVQQSVKPLTETEFQAKLKDRVNVVKKAADAQGIKPPADFALGFAEYTNSLPRSAEVAAELGLHLDVMEKLFSTLVNSGVKSVEVFERSVLPTEKAPPAVEEPEKKPRNNNRSNNRAKKPIITEEAAAAPVLDRYTTKVMFTSDQAPLQSVINTLSDPAKMPHFMVVRLLRIENEQQEGPIKSAVEDMVRQISTGMNTSTAAPGAAIAQNVIAPPAPLPPDAVTIMGNEMLKVYLEVDYIRFRPATEEGEGQDSAAPKQGTAAAATR